MLQQPSASRPSPHSAVQRRRLEAWKEIASYLGRDVTTVRRWEKRERLPVHRHQHQKLGSVYAYTDEIDLWWQRRSTGLATPAAVADPVAVDAAPVAATAGIPDRVTVPRWRAGIAVLVVMGIAVATTAIPFLSRAHAVTETPDRFPLAAPAGVLADSIAISADGQQVAFTSSAPGDARLWIRRIDSQTPLPLAGTAGATFPFWSPDGGSVGFFAGGRLKWVALATREIRDLAAAPDGRGGTWSESGEIVFAPDRVAPLFRVKDTGGPATPVSQIEAGAIGGHVWPEFLPDGRHVLYTDASTDRRRYGIYVMDLDTGVTKRILPVYSSASYSSDGFLLYGSGALVAQRFDLERLTVDGAAIPVVPRVRDRYDIGHKADFSVSRTGVLVVRTSGDERSKLVWIDRASGRWVDALAEPGLYSNPVLSPDARQFIVTVSDDFVQDNLWLFDTGTSAGARLTSGAPIDFAPVWSPDGNEVIFSSTRGGRLNLYRRSLRATGEDVPLLPQPVAGVAESWGAHGRYLTFQILNPKTRFDVWAWPLNGSRAPFPILSSEANEGQSQISPDGRFIAYTSDESGRFEVYVRSFPSMEGKRQISFEGGADPRWRGEGGELYYVASDRRMMVVRVATRPAFHASAARSLFTTTLETLWQDTRNHYDVTPDGGRFLMLAPNTDWRATPFTVIVNWQAALHPQLPRR